MIDIIIGICQSLFMFGAAYWGYYYYSGKVNFSGDAETRRIQRVEQFRGMFFIVIGLCILGGIILLSYNMWILLFKYF